MTFPTFTYKGTCPRTFPDVPYVGCQCVDCRAMRAWRWIRRVVLRRRYY